MPAMGSFRSTAALICVLVLAGGAERGGALTVVKPDTTCVCPRRDIRDYDAQAGLQPERDLLLLSMAELQRRDPDDPTSYYQMARIHGAPGSPYDEVTNGFGSYPCSEESSNCEDGDSTGRSDGYCWHGSTVFPTWHRPYLSLFEQELAKVAKQLARTYPEDVRPTYVAAANQLRLPFWAWEDPQNASVPPILTSAVRSVRQPSGATVDIPNPMYQYTYQRSVGSRGAGTATSREPGYEASVRSMATMWRQDVADALNVTEYAQFATSTLGSTSIENVHGSVHVTVGGDMGTIERAAYDPMFWLHHCNVDKLFAQWQQRRNDSWVGRRTERIENYAIATREGATYIVDGTSPMYPFRWDESNDRNTGFWKSNDVRLTAALGYTYPFFGSPPPSGCCAAPPAVAPPQPVRETFNVSALLVAANTTGFRTILTLEDVDTAMLGAQSFRIDVYIEDKTKKGLRQNLPTSPIQGGRRDRYYAGSYPVFSTDVSRRVSGTVDVTDSLLAQKLVKPGNQQQPVKDLVNRYVRLIAIGAVDKMPQRNVRLARVVSHWGRYENNVFVQKVAISQPLVKPLVKKLRAPKFVRRIQPTKRRTKRPTKRPTKKRPTKRRPTKRRPTKRRPTKRRPTKRPTKRRQASKNG